MNLDISSVDTNDLRRLQKAGMARVTQTVTIDPRAMSTRMRNIVLKAFETGLYAGSWQTQALLQMVRDITGGPMLLMSVSYVSAARWTVPRSEHEHAALSKVRDVLRAAHRLNGGTGDPVRTGYISLYDVDASDASARAEFAKGALCPVLRENPEWPEQMERVRAFLTGGEPITFTKEGV